jgi:hypothetical protein
MKIMRVKSSMKAGWCIYYSWNFQNKGLIKWCENGRRAAGATAEWRAVFFSVIMFFITVSCDGNRTRAVSTFLVVAAWHKWQQHDHPA